MATAAQRPTHFYPLALSTYDTMPPPMTVQKELGEDRKVKYQAVHLFFDNELDLNHYPGSDIADKRLKREALANYVWSIVKNGYDRIV